MKYETIGGKIHDTEHGRTTLYDLKIGDMFTNESRKGKWIVTGERKFSGGHGSSIRMCVRAGTNEREYKSCRMKVYKIK